MMKVSETADGIPLMEDADSDGDDLSIGSFDYETTTSKAAPQRTLHSSIFLQWTRKKLVLLALAVFLVIAGVYLGFSLASSKASVGSTALRPGIHFAAPVGTWLNDPNGLYVDPKGVWHMYYQRESAIVNTKCVISVLTSPVDMHTFIPTDCKNWAHATSEDLHNWEIQPVALECTQTHGIWSGSIVIDEENTSGLFDEEQKDGVVAIYTQHDLDTMTEEQSIAYSADNGLTFIPHKSNPVLAHGSPSYDFRDPKVFWHRETRRWVMVVAVAAEQKIEIYTSMELVEWTLVSTFSNPGLTDEHPSFECPNLLEVPVIDAVEQTGFTVAESGSLPQSKLWMLTVSSGTGHPHMPSNASVVRYFPGSFNGTHFTPADTRNDRLLDFGPDFYATQFFYNSPASTGPVSITWAANLMDCDFVPSGDREHWRGMIGLPRNGMFMLTKDGDIRYLSAPIGLDALRGREIIMREGIKSDHSESIKYEHLPSGALAFDIKLVLNDPIPHAFIYKHPVPQIAIHFRSSADSDGLTCSLAVVKGGPQFTCLTKDDKKKMSTPVPSFNGEKRIWEMQLIMDRSIVEVFLNRGLKAGTMTVWPEKPFDQFKVEVAGWYEEIGTVEVKVQELKLPSQSPRE
jgi:beta-fructofuranosidase